MEKQTLWPTWDSCRRKKRKRVERLIFWGLQSCLDGGSWHGGHWKWSERHRPQGCVRETDRQWVTSGVRIQECMGKKLKRCLSVWWKTFAWRSLLTVLTQDNANSNEKYMDEINNKRHTFFCFLKTVSFCALTHRSSHQPASYRKRKKEGVVEWIQTGLCQN